HLGKFTLSTAISARACMWRMRTGCGTRWATEESTFADMKRFVPKSVGAAFALIEHKMLRGPWVMGEAYTVCDAYLFTLAEWLEGDGVDLSALPRVIDHRKRMSERPAVRKAIQQERG